MTGRRRWLFLLVAGTGLPVIGLAVWQSPAARARYLVWRLAGDFPAERSGRIGATWEWEWRSNPNLVPSGTMKGLVELGQPAAGPLIGGIASGPVPELCAGVLVELSLRENDLDLLPNHAVHGGPAKRAFQLSDRADFRALLSVENPRARALALFMLFGLMEELSEVFLDQVEKMASQDASSEVRAEALSLLHIYREDAACALAERFIRSEEPPKVRRKAAGLLSMSPGGRRLLSALVEDDDPHVAIKAAKVAAQGGDARGIERLIELLTSEDESARFFALIYLKRLTGWFPPDQPYPAMEDREDYKAFARAWRKWWEEEGKKLYPGP